MKALTDTDLFNYLECPARWYAIQSAKNSKSCSKLDDDFFLKYLYETQDFPEWQIEHAKSIFYSGGSKRREFVIAQSAADRILMDGCINKLIFGSESIHINQDLFDSPFECTIPGVDVDNQRLIIGVLGYRHLSQKRCNNGQWINWILADEWPAKMLFYFEMIKREFCLKCTPYLAVVERLECPDYELYDCSEIIESERYKLEMAILDMAGVINKEIDPVTLDKCGFCEHCRESKQITDPKQLTFDI